MRDTVNVISPAIETDAIRNYVSQLAQGDAEEGAKIISNMAAQLPVGRLGTPDDAGSLATFICSDESSFMTGMTFMLDGGLVPLEERLPHIKADNPS